MSHKTDNRQITRQRGAALITSLVILLVLTVLGISAMQNSSLQEKIVGNLHDSDLAFQAAETALTSAENDLSAIPSSPLAPNNNVYTRDYFITNYPPYGLRASANDTATIWNANNATTISAIIPNVSYPPKYIIQFEQFVPDDLDPRTAAQGKGRYYYRITGRGAGTSSNSAVLLQEIYARR